jgi:hypothetical protein
VEFWHNLINSVSVVLWAIIFFTLAPLIAKLIVLYIQYKKRLVVWDEQE